VTAVIGIRRALCISALFVFIASAQAESVRVTQVLDGDSFRLSDGREVRLIGINAPEFGKNGKPNEPLAREAREFLNGMIAGSMIDLEYDEERYDRYHRTLAHATLSDKRRVEDLLLRRGLAFLVAQSPNFAHLTENAGAEAEARHAKRGVWAEAYFKPRAATELTPQDTGFRFVRGRVSRITRTKNVSYLDLADGFALMIPHEYAPRFGDLQHFAGKNVVARGWVTAHENRLHLRVSHPAMLEVVN
jgi:micrococcal nuclease